MDFLSQFDERLTELIFERNLTTDQLANHIGVSGASVRCWKNGTHRISLSNALKLADYFNCSLEYLVARTDVKLDYIPKKCPQFYDRLRKVMEEQKITRYRIVKEKIIYDSNFVSWEKGADPFLQSIINLADYFKCTLDYLVGRDN